jgi:uncharacterized protein YhdP
MLRLVNALWFLLLLSLILIAVYVSLGRHFLSLATDSPAYIEQLLEDILEQPVQIESVQGHWHFLSPSISLHNIDLSSGSQTQSHSKEGLRIGFLQVGIDVFRTLFAREVRLSFLHISGLRVAIYAANGRITRIEGLNFLKRPSAGSSAVDDAVLASRGTERIMAQLPRLLQNLLAEKGLIFKEIEIFLHTPRQSQKLGAKQISLVEVSDAYHIQAELALLEGRPVVLSLHSIMQGQLMAPETWSGRFYADVDRAPAAQWLKHLPILSGRLQSLDVGGALWGEFERASLTKVTGRVALYALDYRATPSSSTEGEAKTVQAGAESTFEHINIPYVSTQFNWIGEIGGRWRMRWQDALVQSKAGEFRPGPVFITREPSAEHRVLSTVAGVIGPADAIGKRTSAWQYRVQGQGVAIADLANLVRQVGVVRGDVAQKLAEAQPSGQLTRFEVILQPPTADRHLHWFAGVSAEKLQWSAVTGLPGVAGLSVTAVTQESNGAAAISVDTGQLDLRPNFRETIPLKHLSLPVIWQRDGSAVHVRSGVALLENEDALGTVMLALSLPNVSTGALQHAQAVGAAGRPVLSLIAGLTRGQEKVSLARYLPTKKMAPGLVRWLDSSLVSGFLESGHFVHEGPITKFPYAANTFQMRFVINDAMVDYQPPWPALTEARVDAFINRREGEYLVPSARVYDATVTNGRVEMPYFDHGEIPRLAIDLHVDADVDQGLRVLRETPLRDRLGAFVDDVVGTGDLAVDLSLDVPLVGPKHKPVPEQPVDEVDPEVLEGGEFTGHAQAEIATENASASRPHLSVDVSVALKAVDLTVPPWSLAVGAVEGPLTFRTGEGLGSTGLRGQFLSQPVQATIQTQLPVQPVPDDTPDATPNRAGGAIAQSDGQRRDEIHNDARHLPRTIIDISGHVTASKLAAWQGLPIMTFLSGETDYRAQVTLFGKAQFDQQSFDKAEASEQTSKKEDVDVQTIAAGEPQDAAESVTTPVKSRPPNVTIRSDLAGLAVDLPEPIGKSADTATELTLSLDLGQRRDIALLAEGIAAMGLRFEPEGLSAVRIHLGADRLTKAETPGLIIMGDTPELLLAPWIEFIERYQNRASVVAASEAVAAAQKTNAPSEPDSAFDWLSELKWADISADGLGYNDKRINQATVQVARIADVWQITLQGTEISGIVSLPLQYFEPAFLDRIKSGLTLASVRERMNARPIDLDIGFLALPAAAQATEQGMPAYLAGPPVILEPIAARINSKDNGVVESDGVLMDGYRRLPPFNMRVRRLLRGTDSLGAWSAQVVATPLGLKASQIQGNIHNVSFTGEGTWTASLGGAATALTGQASSSDLAQSLVGFGFAPVMKSGDAALDLDLSWQGRPWDFDLLTAEGRAGMAVREGTLLNISTTASTVRVIGLLNIEMLTRRMQLDFTDVLNQGMQFQELSGQFDLRDGLLLTDHVKLRGASAQFDISGQISLRAETIDTEMSVTLPVTRNLVLPAAATGGLPAAATAFVIEKALGDKLDKLTTMRFDVTGQWDDPKISRRRRPPAQQSRPGR